METDTLYFFRYAEEGDSTEFAREEKGSNFLAIEMMAKAGMKGNYNFRVETKGKIDMFGSELATETSRWVKALKKAKQTHEESLRTKSQYLYRNIDGLIHLYKKKKRDEIFEFCEKDVKSHFEMFDTYYGMISKFIDLIEEA